MHETGAESLQGDQVELICQAWRDRANHCTWVYQDDYEKAWSPRLMALVYRNPWKKAPSSICGKLASPSSA